MDEVVVVQQGTGDEGDFDQTLRPVCWDEYIGQERVKENVRLILEAAKQRGESCDHLLFYGQAGLGKTTLAYLVGREMGSRVRSVTGPHLERAGDVAAILSALEPHEILFIDEVHRISKAAEEVLYPALESRTLHLVVGKGPTAKTVSLSLPPFTVIAATTKANLLSQPLRSRFGAIFRLEYYLNDDIRRIVRRSAGLLKMTVDDEAVSDVALASRFTPRVANRLLRRCRDYAQVRGDSLVTHETARKTLEMLDVDALGLEAIDRQVLRVIAEKFGGGPVGIQALSAALAEEPGTIEDVYEPFLMSLGFLERTRLGRVVTDKGREYLEGIGT